MKIKYLIFGIMIILSLNMVNAWSSNNFTNNLTFENLTFTASLTPSFTRYLSIPNNTILTNGYLNLSGYLSNNTNINLLSQSSHYSTTNIWTNTTNAYFTNPIYSRDGDWTTKALQENIAMNKYNASIYLNYTIVNNSLYANYTYRYYQYGQQYDSANQQITIYCYNYTSSSYSQIDDISTSSWNTKEDNRSIIINQDCLNSTNLSIKIDLIAGENGNSGIAKAGFYEGDLFYYLNSYPNNSIIYVGSMLNQKNIWNYTGQFNQVNNKTNNIANIINNYLGGCTYLNGFCLVPFYFQSDTAGILQYLDLIFNNDGFLENNVTYNSNVYETSNQNFQLNLTFGVSNPLSVQGILNYGGTNYTSTTSCNGGNCLINNNLDIPTISQMVNKTFYWIVNYYYGSNQFTINSNTYNQSVSNISLTNCNSGTITLNFTTKDETSLSRINPFNFSGSFNYWLGLGSTFKNINFTSSNINEIDLCINPNSTYFTNANIQYSANGYTQKDYYLVNASLNNVTQNIILYLLDSASSTSFIDEVLDTGRNPIADAYIYIQRCYPGNCQTVQVIKTDNTGRSIGFYKTETVDYQHIIMKNGVVIYQDSPHKIFATSTPYTNTFYINSGNPVNFNYSLPSLYESLTYNNNTKLVTYTYIDTSSTFTQGRLLVELMNYSGNYGIVCNTTSSQASATITCDMSTQPESNYYASAYITRGSTETFVDSIIFTLSTAKETFGLTGLFLGFLIILTAGMAFLYHPIAGTWMVTIAMIFTNIVGFTSFTPIWWGGAIVLSIIFTWFFRE